MQFYVFVQFGENLYVYGGFNTRKEALDWAGKHLHKAYEIKRFQLSLPWD